MDFTGDEHQQDSDRSYSFSSLDILPNKPPIRSLAQTLEASSSSSSAPAPVVMLDPTPQVDHPVVRTKRSWLSLKKPSPSSPKSKFATSPPASRSAPAPAPASAPASASASVTAPAPASAPSTSFHAVSTPVGHSLLSRSTADAPRASNGSTRPLTPVTEAQPASPPSVFSMGFNDTEDDDELTGPASAATEPTTVDGDSDDVGYDLKPPPPSVSHVDIERLSLRFFSLEHLDYILADHELKGRMVGFLTRYRPGLAQTLERLLEARKAEAAIEYANSLAEKMSVASSTRNNGVLVAASLHENFSAVSRATTEKLVAEALPAYLTHRLVGLVTDSLVKEITGNNVPIMKDLLPSLAEVYCLSDPNMADNPIVYASEEFYRTTQYNGAYAIGKNCRFLQGPNTDSKVVSRLIQALAEGNEICETILNYRRDGSPFLNLLMIAPLYDNQGAVRYFLGAQVDVSCLVEEGRGVESFAQLLQHEQHVKRKERRRDMKEVLVELGDMMSEEEITTIYNGRRMRSDSIGSLASSRADGHKKTQPPGAKHRKILGMEHDDDRELWSHQNLGKSGRLPGVYRNYLLVRPYPSLRITFTSPALRIPGLLQSRLLDRVGGPQHVREGILEALSSDTSVTAKIKWLVRDRTSSDSDAGGKARWIHCTPLLGSDQKVGVWMVVMVEEEQVTGRLLDRGVPLSAPSIGGESDSSTGGGHSRRDGSVPAQDRLRSHMGSRASDYSTKPSTSHPRPDRNTGIDRNHLYADYLRGETSRARSPRRPRTPDSAFRDTKLVDDEFAGF